MFRTERSKFGRVHAVPGPVAATGPQGKFRTERTVFGEHASHSRNHCNRCVERPRTGVRIARGALHYRHAQRSLHELR